MASLSITHAKHLAIPDGTDTSKVRPSDWNDSHTLGAGNASRLWGRGDSGPGTPEEITLGSNLTMSGTTLSAGSSTVSAASRLIGRGDSGAGDEQEISLGAGISMVGTVLTPAVGSISASSLVGRRSTGAGTSEEIVLGSGLTMSGTTLSAASSGAFDQTATDVEVGNTVTETAIYSKSIIGGTLGTTGKLRGEFFIRAKQQSSGDQSYVLRFKFGATTLITIPSLSPESTSYVNSGFSFQLAGATATNLQVARAWSFAPNVSGGIDPIGFTITRGTSAEDSTAAKTLTITLQWDGTGGAGQSAVMEHATLELIK